MHDKQCSNCLEDRYNALRHKGNHSGYCYNCTYRGDRYYMCFACGCNAGYEMHHIIPQSLNVDRREAAICVPLCLNCHKCITQAFNEKIWTNKYLGRVYTVEKGIEDAKRLLFALFDERSLYYTTREKRNYTILARAYRDGVSGEQREQKDYTAHIPEWSWKSQI